MVNIAAKYKGLITGGLMVLISLLCYYALKIPFNSKEQFIVFLMYTLGILSALISFNKSATTNTKFKDYFQAGFKVFIVVTLIMVVYTIIFYIFNHETRDVWIANNNAMLLKEGDHTPAEIEGNAAQMRKMFMPMMVGINLFKYLILGALITALISGILIGQKKNT